MLDAIEFRRNSRATSRLQENHRRRRSARVRIGEAVVRVVAAGACTGIELLDDVFPSQNRATPVNSSRTRFARPLQIKS